MIKLNASFSKKIPAETDYSSKSYHASVEVELSDGLAVEQIQSKIHDTFELVRSSVESEINGGPVVNVGAGDHVPVERIDDPAPRRIENGGDGKREQPASDKQIKLLFDLGNRNGIRINEMVRDRFEISSYSHLTKRQCSNLIDELVRLDNKAA